LKNLCRENLVNYFRNYEYISHRLQSSRFLAVLLQ